MTVAYHTNHVQAVTEVSLCGEASPLHQEVLAFSVPAVTLLLDPVSVPATDDHLEICHQSCGRDRRKQIEKALRKRHIIRISG